MPDIDGVEVLWVRVNIFSTSLIIGAFYRSPSSGNVFEKIKDYLSENVHANSRVIFAGDFNLPDIDWENSWSSCQISQTLLELSFCHNLNQIVCSPTRIFEEKGSILDSIFLSQNLLERIQCIEVLEGISDHEMVLLTLSLMNETRNTERRNEYLDFSKADDVAIIDSSAFCFSDFLSAYKVPEYDVNFIWNFFENVVLDCINKFIPKRVKIANKKKYVD